MWSHNQRNSSIFVHWWEWLQREKSVRERRVKIMKVVAWRSGRGQAWSLRMDRWAPRLVHGHRRKGEDPRQLGSWCGGGHCGSPFWTLPCFLSETGTEVIMLSRCWELESRGWGTKQASRSVGRWVVLGNEGWCWRQRAPLRFLTMNLKWGQWTTCCVAHQPHEDADSWRVRCKQSWWMRQTREAQETDGLCREWLWLEDWIRWVTKTEAGTRCWDFWRGWGYW